VCAIRFGDRGDIQEGTTRDPLRIAPPVSSFLSELPTETIDFSGSKSRAIQKNLHSRHLYPLGRIGSGLGDFCSGSLDWGGKNPDANQSNHCEH
jgi:hypothetical protein